MEPLPVLASYMTTSGGCKVSNSAGLFGLHNIRATKYVVTDGTVIRADLAQISLGTYFTLMSNAVLKPPLSLTCQYVLSTRIIALMSISEYWLAE